MTTENIELSNYLLKNFELTLDTYDVNYDISNDFIMSILNNNPIGEITIRTIELFIKKDNSLLEKYKNKTLSVLYQISKLYPEKVDKKMSDLLKKISVIDKNKLTSQFNIFKSIYYTHKPYERNNFISSKFVLGKLLILNNILENEDDCNFLRLSYVCPNNIKKMNEIWSSLENILKEELKIN
jgi:hypothetical protein